jgi:hypothetical protein
MLRAMSGGGRLGGAASAVPLIWAPLPLAGEPATVSALRQWIEMTSIAEAFTSIDAVHAVNAVRRVNPVDVTLVCRNDTRRQHLTWTSDLETLCGTGVLLDAENGNNERQRPAQNGGCTKSSAQL